MKLFDLLQAANYTITGERIIFHFPREEVARSSARNNFLPGRLYIYIREANNREENLAALFASFKGFNRIYRRLMIISPGGLDRAGRNPTVGFRSILFVIFSTVGQLLAQDTRFRAESEPWSSLDCDPSPVSYLVRGARRGRQRIELLAISGHTTPSDREIRLQNHWTTRAVCDTWSAVPRFTFTFQFPGSIL